jgi:hypothetical protein
MATIPMIKKAVPIRIKKLPTTFFRLRQRKTPAIPSRSPNKDTITTINCLIYCYARMRSNEKQLDLQFIQNRCAALLIFFVCDEVPRSKVG